MLDLNELMNGLPYITPRWGGAMAEAAGVCLELQRHSQGVLLSVRGNVDNTHALLWPPVNVQTRRTLADHQEATEYGAMAVAVLLAKNEIGYGVIERSAKGTGIDYWLGDEEGLPFQRKARLEVSGILSAGESHSDVERAVTKRVKAKLKQTQSSSGLLPVYVIVVEFGSPLCEVQKA